MPEHKQHRAAIVGASGFTGAELLRLLAGHPCLEVVVATGDSQAGTAIGDLYPSLAAAYPDQVFTSFDAGALDGVDLVFCGLPHGASQALVPEIRGRVGHIVDLAADFRLGDASLYPTWYGEPHAAPELLGDFEFGLPELFRASLRGAELIAAPGCYVTTAALALAPVAAAGLVEPTGIVVDAASGVSRRGPATQTVHHLLHRRRGLQRLRPAHPSAHARDRDGGRPPRGCRRPGAVHAPPGADEPGDPGHLLRPAQRRAHPPTGCSTAFTTPTPTNRSWWCRSGHRPPRPPSGRTRRTSPVGSTPAPAGPS